MTLTEQAKEIWRAGVDAVAPGELIANAVSCSESDVVIADERFPLEAIDRIAVVGAGKAGAGMAEALEGSLHPAFLKKVFGWVNVPENCVKPLSKITLHAARPAGLNKPQPAGVQGAEEVLKIVSGLGKRDLCIVVLSGGGSALLPAPAPGISLEEKLSITKMLEDGGADITELNTVRKQISRVKGGNLARVINAGRTIVLIISDVVGDPLDVIASGPTVADTTTAKDALEVVERRCEGKNVPQSIVDYLNRKAEAAAPVAPIPPTVTNHILGSNELAIKASTERARQLGFSVHSLGSRRTGIARDEGAQLAELAMRIRDQKIPVAPPACILSGGEPTVNLVENSKRGKGGRNQDVALGALVRLWKEGLERIVVLSGGTDGEDGPTNAAGGVVDEELRKTAQQKGLFPEEFVEVNNAYPFLQATGGLLISGPTNTNVMDLRVVLVST